MSVTAAIRRMMASGLTLEQALVAAEAFEMEASPEPVLTKRQERNRRYYERLKASENRLKASETSENSPAPNKESPHTPKEINPTPTHTNAHAYTRGTRLSEDWALPAAWGRWALDEGHSEATIRAEADRFRDFWCSKSGKDATKVDWQATWRNWMRDKKQRRVGAGHQQLTPFQQRHQSAIEIFSKAAGMKPHDDEFAGSTIDIGSADWSAR